MSAVAVDSSYKTALKIGRPALIQPTELVLACYRRGLGGNAYLRDSQVLPAAASHQVSTPAVTELMSNDIDILTIAADNRRGGKGVDGVFHAY